MMIIQFKYFIVFLFLPFILFQVSCGRADPTSNDNTGTPSLQPLSVYNLNISEPSGMAYNSKNNTLMIVSDGSSDIYETDFTGNILRTIPTTSSDMEGITLSQNCDTIYVVEETNRKVTNYLESEVRLNSFTVDVATVAKHALEGIARNSSNNRLIVLNEKLPCMLLEFDGATEIWRKEIYYTTDISDIFYDAAANNLWIVSDESQKILRLAYNTSLVGEWKIPIQQAEGITIVNDKIYIVSDSERRLYVFQKP